jgi:hypothetical protein
MQQRVCDCAAARLPATVIEAWLRAGERLNEEQVAAIAFDGAPLDGLAGPAATTSASTPDTGGEPRKVGGG